MGLISIMGTKSVESEMSDCRGGRICDTKGCSYGWGGRVSDGGGSISSVSESDGVVADASVVLPDAGEGRVHGLRVVGHSGVTV